MAAAEEAPFNEYPLTASALRNDLVIGLPRLVDGWVEVGDAPGSASRWTRTWCGASG